VIALWGSLFFS
jgi:hypothetical protein